MQICKKITVHFSLSEAVVKASVIAVCEHDAASTLVLCQSQEFGVGWIEEIWEASGNKEVSHEQEVYRTAYGGGTPNSP
jgi:hypothetical protein